MNVNKKIMICCYVIMQSLFASDQKLKVDDEIVAVDTKNKHDIRKRDYYANMLKQYNICLGNSRSDQEKQLCHDEYDASLNYVHREEKRMFNSLQNNTSLQNDQKK